MTERVTRPLSIADLLVATATVAVALAICREYRWRSEVCVLTAYCASLVIHSAVFCRAWNLATSVYVAFLVLCCTVAIGPAFFLALLFVSSILEPVLHAALVRGGSLALAFSCHLVIPHYAVFWLHRRYCRAASAGRPAAQQQPLCPLPASTQPTSLAKDSAATTRGQKST